MCFACVLPPFVESHGLIRSSALKNTLPKCSQKLLDNAIRHLYLVKHCGTFLIECAMEPLWSNVESLWSNVVEPSAQSSIVGLF